MPFKNFPTSPRIFPPHQHPWRKAKLTVLGSSIAPCNKSSLPSVFPLLLVLLLSSKEGGENLGKGLLFLEMSRVIRVLIQELIINVILGSSTPRNTDRPGMVPSSRLVAKMTIGDSDVW
ncbi:hypothetical protein PAHAL_7G164500 [Panicum hallii]|uniref:Uncharacterized protein n=1 Tax=Panicum hallii TaxID=206008 RepID=A0A2T8ICG0_9POAL|nr:hypothetical protein PAHAL_7G164500 [Panicum hallii]